MAKSRSGGRRRGSARLQTSRARPSTWPFQHNQNTRKSGTNGPCFTTGAPTDPRRSAPRRRGPAHWRPALPTGARPVLGPNLNAPRVAREPDPGKQPPRRTCRAGLAHGGRADAAAAELWARRRRAKSPPSRRRLFRDRGGRAVGGWARS